MSLEELDIIYRDNNRLREKVEIIKDYIKIASLDFDDLIDLDHIATFTNSKKDELEQIFKLGSDNGLFETTLVYFCSITEHCMGELEKDINPPFKEFCDICGHEHAFSEDDIKKSYKILFKTQFATKSKDKNKVGDSIFSVDFGIITALKVELDSVKNLIPDIKRVNKGVRTYYFGKIDSGSRIYNIVIVKSPNPGSNDSAALTADLINHCNPKFLIKIGIAGGYRGEVELGDVVISNQIFVYDYTKELENLSIIRPEVYRSNYLLLNLIDNFDWDGILISDSKVSKNIIAPIATGNKLVRSEKIWANIREIHDKICALEMEGGGIATVAYQQKDPKGVLIICGISDYGDYKKGDDWHGISSGIAAKFFVDFLKDVKLD